MSGCGRGAGAACAVRVNDANGVSAEEMIDVDLEGFFNRRTTLRDGVRLMQWANYVKRRVPALTASEEMRLLAEDERVMGRSDWWK